MVDALKLIGGHPSYKALAGAAAGGGEFVVSGLRGSAVCVLAAALKMSLKRPLLIVTSSTEKAEWMLDDLETFQVEPLLEFPVADIFAPQREMALDEDMHKRVSVLCSLADVGSKAPVMVTPIQAVLQPVPAPDVVRTSGLPAVVGSTLDRDSLVALLVEAGLEHVPMVEVPGEFSVRGGILDAFSFAAENPLRIEFSGNRVASIRTFDPATQESVSHLKTAVINMSRPGLRAESTVIDHFPRNTIVLFDEPTVLQQVAGDFIRSAGRRGLFEFRDVLGACPELTRLNVTPLPTGQSRDVFEIRCHAAPAMETDPARTAAWLCETAGEYKRCIVLCDTESEVERLRDLLSGHRLPRNVRLAAGRLQHGFAMPEIDLCVITSHEMFNRYRRPRRLSAPREPAAVDEMAGIEEGDYVVHVAHGIGKFDGLKILKSDDGISEFLVLRYADEARVYVPVSQMLLVQKYVGGGRRRPRLSLLRGTEWAGRKEAARQAARGLAARLLRTQAVRVAKKRKEYPEDDDWQREFEASFRFTETDDQLRALGDVKADMRRSTPMDRLICGDVGYGKTELAMRASFKAASAGRQVAVLAPTTILVQQHLRTFTERMAAYPVRIGDLSRFRTESEQKAVLASLADGTMDIVIGTHRLLQADIVFKDLGLVIIDEEQKFGVEQKEYLKRLRETVDVLTLTATPIPRTLHMSLLGLRDISALKTPPQDRLSIETRVVDFDEDIVREGILRELNRNGQVYFIHNRVHNIDSLLQRVERIVPEARIAVAHGQMPSRELEATMSSFLNGEIDVLVSTTIVESGLDIPSVNTIFVNRADDFGLADLHQLRGRVGRYRHRAYAYFMPPERRPVTPSAARRLKAIEDFAYLGAGFDIAMRDLEIRGAGNVLGREQHGHIAAVGYGLYCQLLEAAVGDQSGRKKEPLEWVDVRIGLSAYVPSDYVSNTFQRIDLYRRLAATANEKEIESVLTHMRDRFGPPPKEVGTLAAELNLRIILSRLGVLSARRVGKFLEVTMTEKRPETVKAFTSSGFRQVKHNKLAMEVGDRQPEDLLGLLAGIA